MLKKNLSQAILLIMLSSTFILYITYPVKTDKQIISDENQENKLEQTTTSGYSISIAFNETQKSLVGGYRKIYILIEENYFTKDHLINLFNSLADEYIYPKDLHIYAYSDRKDLQFDLKRVHDGFIYYIVPPQEEMRVRTGLSASYYRSGLYDNGKTDEIIEFTPERNSSETIKIHLKPKTQPESEANSDLLVAAMDGQKAKLQEALNNGANVNTQDKYGDTALMIASMRGDVEIVMELIENGANINAKNDRGGTALMFAIATRKTKTVKLLVDLGADTQIKDNEGQTALGIAERINSKEIIRVLKNQSKTKH